MRVVYLNQDRGIGPGRKKGAAVHVAAMQEAFASLDCEVVALEEKHAGRATSMLETLHAERPIDLIYERYALGAEAGGRFAVQRHVPLVIEVNSPLLEEAALHRGAEHDEHAAVREAALLQAADQVFAVSREVAAYVERLGVPSGRVQVHPNAVDTQRFGPRPSPGLRADLGIPPDTFVLGFHGRLRPWHGFERVAAAARALLERGLSVHVLTVGEGAFSQVLAAAGLAGCSTSLDWVPHEEVARIVAAFDALPLGYGADAPFYFSPLKLLEAMACGAVAVVPDLGDLAQLLGHGAAGLVYPPGDVTALTNALASLIEQPELRTRLGTAACEIAQQHSWTSIARSALAVARGEVAP